MFSAVFWILVSLPLALLGAIYVWKWKIDQRQERIPLSSPLLRPAGESLRLKVVELEEKLSERLCFAVILPICLAVTRNGIAGTPRWMVDVIFVAIGTIVFSIAAVRAFQVASKLRNYRLGFHGERASGEELNQLMREGCHVFHDVPMAPYGNIDHVVVSPTGIYAVETKTRRKKKVPDVLEDHVVTYDGKCLRFPSGTDTGGLEQASRQAKQLQMLLSSATGEPVRVNPILALPGWYVRRISAQGIPVVNPKSARHIVLDRKKPCLDPKHLARVIHQLAQRCRDVTL